MPDPKAGDSTAGARAPAPDSAQTALRRMLNKRAAATRPEADAALAQELEDREPNVATRSTI